MALKKSSKKSNRKLIYKLTVKDFKWIYFKGRGGGGQHRDKKATCCRCIHPPSGAKGVSSDHRERPRNRKLAFRRMAESKKFQVWAKLDALKKIGFIDRIEKEIDDSLANPNNVRIEVKVDGKWVETDNGLE